MAIARGNNNGEAERTILLGMKLSSYIHTGIRNNVSKRNPNISINKGD